MGSVKGDLLNKKILNNTQLDSMFVFSTVFITRMHLKYFRYSLTHVCVSTFIYKVNQTLK